MKIEAETELMKIEPVTYAEIDLQALAGNYRRLKALMAPTVRMAAVIKADAYGHGAVRTARTALNEGASFLERLNCGRRASARRFCFWVRCRRKTRGKPPPPELRCRSTDLTMRGN